LREGGGGAPGAGKGKKEKPLLVTKLFSKKVNLFPGSKVES